MTTRSLILFALIAALLLGSYAGAEDRVPSGLPDLSGRWVGRWAGPKGHTYAGEMVLETAEGGVVSGRIKWTLERSLVERELDKIGLSATEVVEGKFRGDRLDLRGIRTEGPKKVIGLDRYRLVLAENDRVLAGPTWSHGTWLGLARFVRSDGSQHPAALPPPDPALQADVYAEDGASVRLAGGREVALDEGTQLRVQQVGSKSLLVSLPDGSIGWIQKSAVEGRSWIHLLGTALRHHLPLSVFALSEWKSLVNRPGDEATASVRLVREWLDELAAELEKARTWGSADLRAQTAAAVRSVRLIRSLADALITWLRTPSDANFEKYRALGLQAGEAAITWTDALPR